MPETIHPAVEAAYQLLGFIFEADDVVEIRTLGTRPMQRWAKLHDLAPTLQQAADFPAGTHVYFGANPRKENGGKAEHVKQARCLFADFDHGCTLEQARLKWTDACIPEPTVIVATGGGIHAWWRLQEPMEDLARWTDYQDALAQRLGSDRSVTDAPRIMRVPGFVNWKYPERPTCTVLACEPDRAYGLEEFPEPGAFQQEAQQAPATTVAAGSLSDLAKRFFEDGYLIPGYGRRDTIFTVACDLKARQWAQGDAEVAIMRRARLLGLGPDDLADLPRQISNAFKGERTPLQGPAEQAVVVIDDTPAIGIRDLLQRNPKMRRPIVHDLLRSGETMNIIAAPKTGKSWMVLDLALCVATGRPWLHRFTVERSSVLLVDNELHEETLADRLQRVATAKGMTVEDLDGWLEVKSLRGALQSFKTLDAGMLAPKRVEPGRYGMVIFDAFYRFNCDDGCDENDNGYMARTYNLLDSMAKRLDACLVCIHHTSKGNQSDKAVTDVGAGAGSMSRAADTHLVLREHELQGHLVVDAACRSWKPLEPTVVRFEYPLFHPEPALAPTLKKRAKKDDGWSPERFADEIIGKTAVDGKTVLARSLKAGLTESRCKTLRMAAAGDGLIENIGGNTKTALWVCRVPITHSSSHLSRVSESSPNQVCKAVDSEGETLKGSPLRINQQPVGDTK